MTALRAALLSPVYLPSLRGNSITVNRIATGLGALGVELRVWDCSTTTASQLEAEVEAYRPTLIHAFHAYRVGPLALSLSHSLKVPLLVTITGTDGNHDLFDHERAQTVRRVLLEAACVVVFQGSMREKIARELPEVAARMRVIPQSVHLENGPSYPLAERIDLPDDAVIFLFAAGIRVVKNSLFPLDPFDQLVAHHPSVRLIYAGPILEPAEGERLLSALAHRAWAIYLGEVPHSQMRSLLEASHVVLNCSLSESMPNSVLESMCCARPVLASDIDGNRSLVEDGVTGFLFTDPAGLEAKATRLVEDPELRRRMGLAGQDRVRDLFQPDQEVEGYLAQYRAASKESV
ncbi:MAG: glycosyltransferase family 4 protein [Chloroflexi bacterium]|nr:glycosyltransferase family 4 protein [Chloroflexota bacterium]